MLVGIENIRHRFIVIDINIDANRMLFSCSFICIVVAAAVVIGSSGN